jgi:Rad3-related DNA helicase
VRRASDRGVVVVADPRAVTRSYGAVFRAALPVTLERTGSVDDLVERAARFLGPAPEGERT